MIATQFETQLFTSTDCLISRKLALAQQTEIPDMAAYAEEWNKLAADFEACGLMNNAADCEARFVYYRDMNPGAYIRKIEMPFADIVQVSDDALTLLQLVALAYGEPLTASDVSGGG
jgi:hypothetical protein